MFVITSPTVAFRLLIDCRFESVALMVDRMKLAVDLRVVTEFAGITVGVGSGEVPANISACVGCISRFDERIALIVYEVARTARYAVVAGAVFLAVVAMELIAFL